MRRYNRAAAVAPDLALAELLARAQLAEEQRDTARAALVKARAALVKARDKASAACHASSAALTRARRSDGDVKFWQAAYDRDVAVWAALDRLAKH